MRRGGGKQKGSSFERQICKDLSLWLSHGKRSDLLWRSAMSGGRSTVAFKKGQKLKNQAGDISAIDPLGHALTDKFIVECKHIKKLDLGSIIKNKGTIIAFWKKLKKESKKFRKMPMLIARQNSWPVIICLDLEGVVYLLWNTSFPLISEPNDLRIMLFSDFLKKPFPFKPRKKRIRL